jgi:hypothetical protein
VLNDAPNQEAAVPLQFANVPPDLSPATGHLRIIVKVVEDSVQELKQEVKGIKADRHSDFVLTVSVFAAGFVILAGMLIFGYFRLDDKIEAISTRLDGRLEILTIDATRIDTKLEDLLARIPPAQTPVPAPPKK